MKAEEGVDTGGTPVPLERVVIVDTGGTPVPLERVVIVDTGGTPVPLGLEAVGP